MIAYLTLVSFHNSAAALRQEAGIGDEFDDVTRKKYEGMLERKWTSVVRLQKKVNRHLYHVIWGRFKPPGMTELKWISGDGA